MTTGNTHVISLNGNPYVVRLPVREYAVEQQSPAFRTTGAFARINNPKAEPYAFNDWSRGFGTKTVRAGRAEDRAGFFDATVMTIWKQSLVLPLTPQDIVDIADYQISASATFKGSTWALFTPNTDHADPNASCEIREYTGDAWSNGGQLFNNGTTWGYDLIAAGSKLYAIVGINTDWHVMRYSTDGATWTAPATTPPTTGLLTDHEVQDGAKLTYDGANVIVALKDDTNGQIKLQTSTDGGDTWGNPAGGAIAVASGGGPNGLTTYLDTDGSTVVYMGAQEGVWLIDLAAGTAELVITMAVAAENGKRLVAHNGSLYIPVDHGDAAPFGMKRITISGTDRIIEDVGLDVVQGIPSNLLGKVQWCTSIGPWLFVAIKGNGASRTARILALSGIPGEGWQNVYKHGSANDPITWLGGSGNDLLFQEGGLALTDPGNSKRLDNMFAPPNSGLTFVYDSVGDLELPDFGGDAPSESGGFLQAQIDALDLVDAAEEIHFEYGLNGATPTTDDTNTLNSTNRKVGLGTSSRGLSARTIRTNWEFNRGGTTGNTPKVSELVLLFRKEPANLHGWEVEIDLEETARQFPRRGIAVLLSELNTVETSNTLVPFQLATDDTERQVEMVAPAYGWWLEGRQGGQSYAYRAGIMQIKIEEVVG